MNKEALFELIRKEEVVLWAGAGLSLYAGYPSGKEVAEILLESFPSEYRNELDVNKPLPQFVEDYVTLCSGNVNTLIRTLNKRFLVAPKSIKHHEIMASIPHIHNVITTNYDRLFEIAYGSDKLFTVLSSANLAYLDKSKTKLFKIHGDLQDPDSIIIAAKDYRKFFIEKQHQLLWKYIETILATKAVVFVGYSLDDVNILTMYEKLMEDFKNHKPEAYFVSPSISKIKAKELERLNIRYIQQTGEEFFEELLQNINDNILTDVENGYTSADTFKSFIEHRDLHAKFQNESVGYRISGLSKSNGEANGKVDFKIVDNPELSNKLNDLMSRKNHNSLTLSMDDLVDVNIRVEGLKLPLGNRGEYRLVLSPSPSCQTLCDFTFNDFEIGGVALDVFKLADRLRINAKLHTGVVSLDVFFGEGEANGKLHVENALENEQPVITSTQQQIELYTFASNLAQGTPFKIFLHNNQQALVFHPSATSSGGIEKNVEYFKRLKLIEKTFDVRFTSFKDINGSMEDVVNLYKAITNFEEEVVWDGEVPFKSYGISPDEVDNIIQKVKEGNAGSTVLNAIQSAKLEIHGKTIAVNLIDDYNFLEPVIVQSANGDGLCFRSKNNKYLVKHRFEGYSESPLPDAHSNTTGLG